MDIARCIESEFDDMVTVLDRLIRVQSVGGEPEECAPFGKGPRQALDEVLDIASEMGFYARNRDDRVAEIDIYDDAEPAVGILCHADVVPAGNGWTYEPFRATRDSGKIFGRGAIDDKGPLTAALFAMKLLRDNVRPRHNIRLIVGTDEERGSNDLAYYRERYALPALVFTPDASYPVINTEKGRATGILLRKCMSQHVVSARGGSVVNAVPDRASAVLKDITLHDLEAAAEKCAQICGVQYEISESGEGTFTVLAKGTGAHASLPEGGVNAVTGLFTLLAYTDSDAESGNDIWRSALRLSPHGSTDGGALGIACSDDISGALTYSLDLLEYEDGIFKATFDIRFPVCMSGDALRARIAQAAVQEGFELDSFGASEPHHTDGSSLLVKTLLEVYGEASRDDGYRREAAPIDIKALSTGGGTYAHGIPGAVAFGPELPGSDNHMHAADEFISEYNLKLCARLIYNALEKLDLKP